MQQGLPKVLALPPKKWNNLKECKQVGQLYGLHEMNGQMLTVDLFQQIRLEHDERLN